MVLVPLLGLLLILAAIVAAAISVDAREPQTGGRLYAGGAAAPLVAEGLLAAAPAGLDAAGFVTVPPPGLRSVRNDAQATAAPWVDSNGWRFRRGLGKVNYDALPAGAGPLAAAEAFAFGVEAILHPDAADLDELRKILAFLQRRTASPMTALANVGIVDDGSSEMGEVLNMLTRRNLLYRVVQRPDPELDLNVEVGTARFPRGAVTNPGDFAARVREALGDERRLVRIYGSTTVIAHLTGDSTRARLQLLSYSRNRSQSAVRIRLLGRYQPAAFAAYGATADAVLSDIRHPDNAETEFSLPAFNTIAIVELDRQR
jgi:hypothetical protein